MKKYYILFYALIAMAMTASPSMAATGVKYGYHECGSSEYKNITKPKWPQNFYKELGSHKDSLAPGFNIFNATHYNFDVSLHNVGPLYYEVVQPGGWFKRSTGSWLFDIQAAVNLTPDGKAKYTDDDVAWPIVATVATTLLAVGTGGASIGVSGSALAGYTFTSGVISSFLVSTAINTAIVAAKIAATTALTNELSDGRGLINIFGTNTPTDEQKKEYFKNKYNTTIEEYSNEFAKQFTKDTSYFGSTSRHSGWAWPAREKRGVYVIRGGPGIPCYEKKGGKKIPNWAGTGNGKTQPLNIIYPESVGGGPGTYSFFISCAYPFPIKTPGLDTKTNDKITAVFWNKGVQVGRRSIKYGRDPKGFMENKENLTKITKSNPRGEVVTNKGFKIDPNLRLSEYSSCTKGGNSPGPAIFQLYTDKNVTSVDVMIDGNDALLIDYARLNFNGREIARFGEFGAGGYCIKRRPWVYRKKGTNPPSGFENIIHNGKLQPEFNWTLAPLSPLTNSTGCYSGVKFTHKNPLKNYQNTAQVIPKPVLQFKFIHPKIFKKPKGTKPKYKNVRATKSTKRPSSWNKLPGAAYDIGVGGNGKVWVIGTNKEAGGYGIYRLDGKKWKKIAGSAVRIAVGPKGNAWVVNKQRNIFRYNGRKWIKMPGAAHDIGVGARGHVWVVGTNKVGGGYGVYRWTGKTWKAVPGGLTNLAVGPRGKVWGVNSGRNIYKMQ